MTLKIVFSILVCFVIVSGCISGLDTAKSNLQFTSSPSGAEVYINNQYRGSTPCTISDIETGNYTLEMRYPGYQTWSTGISVSSGSSNFYAALTPLLSQQPQNITPQITTPPVKITVQASRDTMIIGNSNSFSGTCTGCDSVELTLFGPGYYEQGVSLDQPKTNSVGSWSYTWNPGYSIQSGHYTLVANNPDKTTSDRVEFLVVGGGVVTIASSSYSADKGDTLKFSGQCTTGAHNVVLVLYGPERFSSGIELGTISVTADNSWSFKYTLDTSIPTGIYTMYAYDIPTTASSTTQFTVGFV
ncbi:MAG: PEGA domain-containing protein [Methanoregula sp.]|nr:PEGA domain-containing protein [Methanoregula sp.]